MWGDKQQPGSSTKPWKRAASPSAERTIGYRGENSASSRARLSWFKQKLSNIGQRVHIQIRSQYVESSPMRNKSNVIEGRRSLHNTRSMNKLSLSNRFFVNLGSTAAGRAVRVFQKMFPPVHPGGGLEVCNTLTLKCPLACLFQVGHQKVKAPPNPSAQGGQTFRAPLMQKGDSTEGTSSQSARSTCCHRTEEEPIQVGTSFEGF